ncbi:MAG: PPC domain-containing protein [Myxococcota bacterium]
MPKLVWLLGALVGLLAIAFVAATALYLVRRANAGSDLPSAPPLPNPVAPGPTAPEPPPPQESEARYRPGPYVEVVGTLPEGELQVTRLNDRQTGRSIETPWVVGGAELRPGAAPDPTGAGSPRLSPGGGGDGTIAVLPGVPRRLGFRTQPGESGAGDDANGEVMALVVAFHDYPGHFYLPASADTELGHVMVAGVDNAEVHFGIHAAVFPDGRPIHGTAPHPVRMYIAAVDVEGRVSPYVQREVLVQPVGSGDVDVSLTMSAPTDLDLYVVDASGTVIYYGNRHSTGGQLDLDANAACTSNVGVNAEHIFWPVGAAAAGTYTVRVAHFESCIENAPVTYEVTVQNCGETVVFAGRFEGAGDTETCDRWPGSVAGDRRNWCQQVVEFEVSPCSPS